MKRGFVSIALVTFGLVPATALAQEPPPPLPPPAPAPTAEPPPASDLLAPTPADWKLRYDDAREKLVIGDFADAAVRFSELERSAVNRTDRALAHAQATLATEWARRGLAFVHQKDLGESTASAKAVDRRTTDELVSIYTNAVFYGLGSGLWLAALTEPQTASTAVLPALALTGASVGTVVALDSGRGFHYGIPQSIVSGLWIGLEEGIVWSSWWASKHVGSSNDETKTAATMIWAFSTAGAVGGGVLGATLGTTPGRSAWVGSVTLWSGALFGFGVGALSNGLGNADTDNARLAAGLAGTAGIGVGLATASLVSPSIARVRFIDLGGLSGGLLAAGLYVAATNNKANAHATAGFTALGGAVGLGTAWALTSSMPEDRLRGDEPNPPTSALARMRPMLLPGNGGAMMGVGGALD
jgi:hypothetical protein